MPYIRRLFKLHTKERRFAHSKTKCHLITLNSENALDMWFNPRSKRDLESSLLKIQQTDPWTCRKSLLIAWRLPRWSGEVSLLTTVQVLELEALKQSWPQYLYKDLPKPGWSATHTSGWWYLIRLIEMFLSISALPCFLLVSTASKHRGDTRAEHWGHNYSAIISSLVEWIGWCPWDVGNPRSISNRAVPTAFSRWTILVITRVDL